MTMHIQRLGLTARDGGEVNTAFDIKGQRGRESERRVSVRERHGGE